MFTMDVKQHNNNNNLMTLSGKMTFDINYWSKAFNYSFASPSYGYVGKLEFLNAKI